MSASGQEPCSRPRVTPEYPGWIRLPCPSTSTMSLSFAAWSTSCSAAPAMKSATTASTAMPHPSMKIPVCPVATKLVRWPRWTSASCSCSCAVILPTLQSDPTASTTSASTSAARLRERPQLGIVADERMQATPDLEFLVDRAPEPGPPLLGKPAAGGSDPDHHRRRSSSLRDPPLEVPDHRYVAAEAEDVLRGLPSLLAIQHCNDALGEVANAGVGGLGRQWPEVAVGDDEEAMLGNRHFLAETATWRRSTPLHGSVGRSTAGLKRPASP